MIRGNYSEYVPRVYPEYLLEYLSLYSSTCIYTDPESVIILQFNLSSSHTYSNMRSVFALALHKNVYEVEN